MDNLSTEYLIR